MAKTIEDKALGLEFVSDDPLKSYNPSIAIKQTGDFNVPGIGTVSRESLAPVNLWQADPTRQEAVGQYMQGIDMADKYLSRENITPEDLDDINEVMYRNQSTAEAVANGFVSRAISILPKTLNTIGSIGGLGYGMMDYMFDAINPNEEADLGRSLNQGLDNFWVRGMNHWDESLKELMPVFGSKYGYYSDSLMDNLSSAKFWAEDGFDGLAFTASAFIPGAGWAKGLDVMSKTAKGANFFAQTAKFAKYGKAAQAMNAMSKEQLVASGVDKLTNILTTATNVINESALEAYEATKNFDKDTFIAKKLQESPEAKRIMQLEEQVSMMRDDSEIAGLINPEEGPKAMKMRELQEAKDNLLNQLDEEYLEAKGQLGLNVFRANNLVLVLPDYLQSKLFTKAFGNASKSIRAEARQTANKAIRTSSLKEGFKQAGYAVGREGFWEENAQTASSTYYQEKAFGSPRIDNDVVGILDNMIQNATFQDKEGAKSIILGAVAGGLSSFGLGAYAQREKNKEFDKETKLWQNILTIAGASIKTAVDDWRGLADENGNISTDNFIKAFTFAKDKKASIESQQVALLLGNEIAHELGRNDEITKLFWGEVSSVNGSKYTSQEEAIEVVKSKLTALKEAEGADKETIAMADGFIDKVDRLSENLKKAEETIDKVIDSENANAVDNKGILTRSLFFAMNKLAEVNDLIDNAETISDKQRESLGALATEYQEAIDALSDRTQVKGLVQKFTDDANYHLALQNQIAEETAKPKETQDPTKLKVLKYQLEEFYEIYGFQTAADKKSRRAWGNNSLRVGFAPTDVVNRGTLGLRDKYFYDLGRDALVRNEVERLMADEGGDVTAAEIVSFVESDALHYLTKEEADKLAAIADSKVEALERAKQEAIDVMDLALYTELGNSADDEFIKSEGKAYKESPSVLIAEAVAKKSQERSEFIGSEDKEMSFANNIRRRLATKFKRDTDVMIEKINEDIDSYSNIEAIDARINDTQDRIDVFEQSEDHKDLFKGDSAKFIESLKEQKAVLEQLKGAAINNKGNKEALDTKLKNIENQSMMSAFGLTLDGNKVKISNMVLIDKIKAIVGVDALNKLISNLETDGMVGDYVFMDKFMYDLTEDQRTQISEAIKAEHAIVKDRLSKSVFRPKVADGRLDQYAAILENPQKILTVFLGSKKKFKKGEDGYIFLLSTTNKKNIIDRYMTHGNLDLLLEEITIDNGKTLMSENVKLTAQDVADTVEFLKDMIQMRNNARILSDLASTSDMSKFAKAEKDLLTSTTIGPSQQQRSTIKRMYKWLGDFSSTKNSGFSDMIITNGIAGTGKTMVVAKMLFKILAKTNGISVNKNVVVLGATKEVADNLSNSIGKTIGATSKAVEDLKEEDLNDNISIIAVDEIGVPDIVRLGELSIKLRNVNAKRIERGLKPIKLIGFGDPNQVTEVKGDNASRITELEGKVDGVQTTDLIDIKFAPTLLVQYRSDVDAINEAADEFSGRKKPVKNISAVSNVKNDDYEAKDAKGVHAYDNINSFIQRIEGFLKANENKTITLAYNTPENKDEIYKRLSDEARKRVVFKNFFELQGLTIDNLFINVKVEGIDQKRFNSSMYMLLSRATNYVAINDNHRNFTQKVDPVSIGKVADRNIEQKVKNKDAYDKVVEEELAVMGDVVVVKKPTPKKPAKPSVQPTKANKPELNPVNHQPADQVEEEVDDTDDREITAEEKAELAAKEAERVKPKSDDAKVGDIIEDTWEPGQVKIENPSGANFKAADLKDGDKLFVLKITPSEVKDGPKEVAILVKEIEVVGEKKYIEVAWLNREEVKALGLEGHPLFESKKGVDRSKDNDMYSDVEHAIFKDESGNLIQVNVDAAREFKVKYDPNIKATGNIISDTAGYIANKFKILTGKLNVEYFLPTRSTMDKTNPKNIYSSLPLDLGVPYLIVTLPNSKTIHVRLNPKPFTKDNSWTINGVSAFERLELFTEGSKAIIKWLEENSIATAVGSSSYRDLLHAIGSNKELMLAVDNDKKFKLAENISATTFEGAFSNRVDAEKMSIFFGGNIDLFNSFIAENKTALESVLNQYFSVKEETEIINITDSVKNGDPYKLGGAFEAFADVVNDKFASMLSGPLGAELAKNNPSKEAILGIFGIELELTKDGVPSESETNKSLTAAADEFAKEFKKLHGVRITKERLAEIANEAWIAFEEGRMFPGGSSKKISENGSDINAFRIIRNMYKQMLVFSPIEHTDEDGITYKWHAEFDNRRVDGKHVITRAYPGEEDRPFIVQGRTTQNSPIQAILNNVARSNKTINGKNLRKYAPKKRVLVTHYESDAVTLLWESRVDKTTVDHPVVEGMHLDARAHVVDEEAFKMYMSIRDAAIAEYNKTKGYTSNKDHTEEDRVDIQSVLEASIEQELIDRLIKNEANTNWAIDDLDAILSGDTRRQIVSNEIRDANKNGLAAMREYQENFSSDFAGIQESTLIIKRDVPAAKPEQAPVESAPATQEEVDTTPEEEVEAGVGLLDIGGSLSDLGMPEDDFDSFDMAEQVVSIPTEVVKTNIPTSDIEAKKADIERRRQEELKRMSFNELMEEFHGNNLRLIPLESKLGDATFRVNYVDLDHNEITIDYKTPGGTRGNFNLPISQEDFEKYSKKYKDVEWSDYDINAKYDAELAELAKEDKPANKNIVSAELTSQGSSLEIEVLGTSGKEFLITVNKAGRIQIFSEKQSDGSYKSGDDFIPRDKIEELYDKYIPESTRTAISNWLKSFVGSWAAPETEDGKNYTIAENNLNRELTEITKKDTSTTKQVVYHKENKPSGAIMLPGKYNKTLTQDGEGERFALFNIEGDTADVAYVGEAKNENWFEEVASIENPVLEDLSGKSKVVTLKPGKAVKINGIWTIKVPIQILFTNDYRSEAFLVKEGTSRKQLGRVINVNTALAYLRRLFPNADINTFRFLESVRGQGKDVFGRFIDGIIEVEKIAKSDNLYENIVRHEAFHKVWREFMTASDRKIVVEAYLKTLPKEEQAKYSNMSYAYLSMELEEHIARAYQVYNKNQDIKPGPMRKAMLFLKRIFRDLVYLLTGNPAELNHYFNLIDYGFFNTQFHQFRGSKGYYGIIKDFQSVDNYIYAKEFVAETYKYFLFNGRGASKIPMSQQEINAAVILVAQDRLNKRRAFLNANAQKYMDKELTKEQVEKYEQAEKESKAYEMLLLSDKVLRDTEKLNDYKKILDDETIDKKSKEYKEAEEAYDKTVARINKAKGQDFPRFSKILDEILPGRADNKLATGVLNTGEQAEDTDLDYEDEEEFKDPSADSGVTALSPFEANSDKHDRETKMFASVKHALSTARNLRYNTFIENGLAFRMVFKWFEGLNNDSDEILLQVRNRMINDVFKGDHKITDTELIRDYGNREDVSMYFALKEIHDIASSNFYGKRYYDVNPELKGSRLEDNITAILDSKGDVAYLAVHKKGKNISKALLQDLKNNADVILVSAKDLKLDKNNKHVLMVEKLISEAAENGVTLKDYEVSAVMQKEIFRNTWVEIQNTFSSMKESNLIVVKRKDSFKGIEYSVVSGASTEKQQLVINNIKDEIAKKFKTKPDFIAWIKTQATTFDLKSDDIDVMTDDQLKETITAFFKSIGITSKPDFKNTTRVIWDSVVRELNWFSSANMVKWAESQEAKAADKIADENDAIAGRKGEEDADYIDEVFEEEGTILNKLASVISSENTKKRAGSFRGADDKKRYTIVMSEFATKVITQLKSYEFGVRGGGIKLPDYLKTDFMRANPILAGLQKIHKFHLHGGNKYSNNYSEDKVVDYNKEGFQQYMERSFMAYFMRGFKKGGKAVEYFQPVYVKSNRKDTTPAKMNVLTSEKIIDTIYPQIFNQQLLQDPDLGDKWNVDDEGTPVDVFKFVNMGPLKQAIMDATDNKFTKEKFVEMMRQGKTWNDLDAMFGENTVKKTKENLNKYFDGIAKQLAQRMVTDGVKLHVDMAQMVENLLVFDGMDPKVAKETVEKEFKDFGANLFQSASANAKKDGKGIYSNKASMLEAAVRLFAMNNEVNSYALDQIFTGNQNVFGKGVSILKRMSVIFGPGMGIATGPMGAKVKSNVLVLKDPTYGSEYRKLIYGQVGLTESEISELLSKNSRGAINYADGQGYITPKRAQELRRAVGASYNLSTVGKPLWYDIDENGVAHAIKYSWIELTDEIVSSDSTGGLKALRNLMEKHDVDEAVFASAVKVGLPKGVVDWDSIMNGKVEDADVSKAMLQMKNANYRLQLNPEHGFGDNNTAVPSQLMFILNILNNNVEEANKAYDALMNLYKIGFKELSEKIKKHGKLSEGKVLDTLKTKFKSSPSAEIESNLLDEGVTTDWPAITNKAFSQMTSLFSKNTINQRLKGGKTVLMASNGVTVNGRELSYSVEADADGRKTIMSEAVLTREAAKQILTPEEYKELNDAIAEGRTPNLIFTNGNLFGYRIPSSELHSGVALKIVGLIDGPGVNIVVPKYIVEVHGSDFDVDSLFVIGREVLRDKEGYMVNYTENEKTGLLELWELEEDEINELSTKDKKRYYKNIITEMLLNAISKKENFVRANSAISLASLEGLRVKIARETGGSVVKSEKNLSNVLEAFEVHQSSHNGSDGVGIFASSFKAIAYAMRAGLNKAIPRVTINDNDDRQKLVFNGKLIDLLSNKITTFEMIDALVNAAVDNVKEQILPYFNLNANTMSSFVGMLALDSGETNGISNSNELAGRMARQLFFKNIADYKSGNSFMATAGVINDIAEVLKKLGKDIPESYEDLTTEELTKALSFNEKAGINSLNELFEKLKGTSDAELIDFAAQQVKFFEFYKSFNKVGEDLSKLSGLMSILREFPSDAIALETKVKDFGSVFEEIHDKAAKPIDEDLERRIDYSNVKSKDSFSIDLQELFVTAPHLAEAHKVLTELYLTTEFYFFKHSKEVKRFVEQVSGITGKILNETSNDEVAEEDKEEGQSKSSMKQDIKTKVSMRDDVIKFLINAINWDPAFPGYNNLPPAEIEVNKEKRTVAGVDAFKKHFGEKIYALKEHLKTVSSEQGVNKKILTNKFIDELSPRVSWGGITEWSMPRSVDFKSEDLIRLKADFEKLNKYDIKYNKATKKWEVTETDDLSYKEWQKDFVRYGTIVNGMSFGASSFSLALPSDLYMGLSDGLRSMVKIIKDNPKILYNNKNRFFIQYAFNNILKVKSIDTKAEKEGGSYSGFVEIQGKEHFFNLKFPLEVTKDKDNNEIVHENMPSLIRRTGNKISDIFMLVGTKDKHAYYIRLGAQRPTMTYNTTEEEFMAAASTEFKDNKNTIMSLNEFKGMSEDVVETVWATLNEQVRAERLFSVKVHTTLPHIIVPNTLEDKFKVQSDLVEMLAKKYGSEPFVAMVRNQSDITISNPRVVRLRKRSSDSLAVVNEMFENNGVFNYMAWDENDFDQDFYTGRITPSKDTIFVFGSNPEGKHGMGAAAIAKKSFGAKEGVGEGLQGSSFAIPTKDLSKSKALGIYDKSSIDKFMKEKVIPYYLENEGSFEDVINNNPFERSVSPEQIIESIRKMYEIAENNPDKKFKVAFTEDIWGWSLNGYLHGELIEMFKAAGKIPSNVLFSETWANSGKFVNSNFQEKRITLTSWEAVKDNETIKSSGWTKEDWGAKSQEEKDQFIKCYV